jgi:formylglycine-generating enzyme required for sulfatase activity
MFHQVTFALLTFFTVFSMSLTCYGESPVAEASPVADSMAELGISQTQPAEQPFVEVDGKYMVPYRLVIPGSSVTVEMIPVPGGEFEMGSSEEDESPQVAVKVLPMWVAKNETSWREYGLYMSMYRLFNSITRQGLRKADASNAADAVTAPTELYDSTFTYKYGQDAQLPAVTMTQFAAKQYTKWLSKLTGHQYRLPTEAEWEYACRAGSTANYSFGDDEAELGDYAWYADNADEQPHPVGLKKPNAFGLHDMHGNVMEWVVDEYTEDGFAALADKTQPLSLPDTIQWPTSVDRRGLRGGSWQDFAEDCRCSKRMGSGDEEEWKELDPNLPLSPWWFTNDPTRGIGFRIFRSYQPLEDQLISKFWEVDHQYLEEDVASRLNEGRGIRCVVDPELAEQIKTLQQ